MKAVLNLGVLLTLLGLAGCDVPVDRYPANDLYALVVSTSRQVPDSSASEDATVLVEDWFGTPLEPRWPTQLMSDATARDFLSQDNLSRSAGLVFSDQDNRHFGLFNEHCVTCHGVSGGGDGPASQLQNPYPRDFRAGVFKWKSTERKAKPTKSDLRSTIVNGIPGTGMPSFARIDERDIDALVDYTIFLSIRGEFERRLLAGAIDELGYEEAAPDDEANLALAANADTETDATLFAVELLDELVSEWVDADQRVVPVPDEPVADQSSIERGRELFHGQVVNCAGCHGTNGNGQTETLDWDDWTKEYTTKLSITPSDRDAVRPFREAGAPRPRQIQPRRLTSGVFRGGGDANTLYRRFITGIAGTPMPAVQLSQDASPTTLSADQMWDIVHYVRSLGEDDASEVEP